MDSVRWLPRAPDGCLYGFDTEAQTWVRGVTWSDTGLGSFNRFVPDTSAVLAIAALAGDKRLH